MVQNDVKKPMNIRLDHFRFPSFRRTNGEYGEIQLNISSEKEDLFTLLCCGTKECEEVRSEMNDA